MSETVERQSFPATRWSLIARARGDDPSARKQALGELVGRYLGVLRSHLVRRRRLDVQHADDLLQSFLVDKVLENDLFAFAQQEKGRFRTFLLTAVGRFLIDQSRRQGAAKRSPENIGAMDDEFPVADDQPAVDAQFDRDWAQNVIEQAVERTRRECESANRPDLWGVLDHRVIGPMLRGEEAIDYAALVQKYSITSPAHAANLLVTAKRMFVRALRGVIADYAGDDEVKVDQELADLQRIVAGD